MPPADQSADGEDPRVLTVGRINLDFYVSDLGVAMRDARTFVASVGGSPTNIAIVAQRLGVPAAVLTATGDDFAGQLVRRQLTDEGVDVRWVQTVPGAATSMAILAQPAPDEGERQFFRVAPADSLLTAEHASDLPWDTLDILLLSGDAMASGSTPALVPELVESARAHDTEVWWDLDLRPSSWPSPDDYGATLAPAVVAADVVIGTEEEFSALLGLEGPTRAELIEAIGAMALPHVALKLGADGVVLIAESQVQATAPSMTDHPVCTVGGGDAAAGSLVAARLAGQSWPDALTFAMRVAGHTVEQPYCSDGFPTITQMAASAPTPARSVL